MVGNCNVLKTEGRGKVQALVPIPLAVVEPIFFSILLVLEWCVWRNAEDRP